MRKRRFFNSIQQIMCKVWKRPYRMRAATAQITLRVRAIRSGPSLPVQLLIAESKDTEECIDEDRKAWNDCVVAQTDLSHRNSLFSRYGSNKFLLLIDLVSLTLHQLVSDDPANHVLTYMSVLFYINIYTKLNDFRILLTWQRCTYTEHIMKCIINFCLITYAVELSHV